MNTINPTKFTIGYGIKPTTYFKLMLFYPYGDDRLSYVHIAIFGMN